MTLVKAYQFLKPTRKLRGRPPLFYSDKYKDERTRDIVNIVRDNQPVTHGRLLRIISKRHRLAGESTVEPFLKKLVADRTLARVSIGKQKVVYYVPEVEDIDSSVLDASVRSRIAILGGEINRLEREFAKTPFEEKWVFTKYLVTMAFDGIKECALLTVLSDDPAGNLYHVEEQSFRMSVRKIIEIVKSDRDSPRVFPLIRPVLTLHHAPRKVATWNLPYYPPDAAK